MSCQALWYAGFHGVRQVHRRSSAVCLNIDQRLEVCYFYVMQIEIILHYEAAGKLQDLKVSVSDAGRFAQ